MKKIGILFIFLLLIVFSGGKVCAQSVEMRIPDTTTVNGAVLDIPIYADSSLTGKNVGSYFLQISYDTYYFKPVSVITSGTLSQPFGQPSVNTSVSGVITLAGAGAVPLTGRGRFVVLRFEVLHAGNSRLNFTDVAHNYLNEGTPSVILNNGNISISSLPTISISPDNGIIAKGEKLQMSVYGGNSPYSWSTTPGNVATIDSNGQLTATEIGLTRVVAVDQSGVRDTTGLIEVRPIRLSISTTLTQWEGAIIDVPVVASDLTGLNVLSGKFEMEFDKAALSPESVIQTGTKLEAYSVFVSKADGLVSVAFAGSAPLTGAGTLAYVRFKVLPYPYSGTYLTLRNSLINETILTANTRGYLTVRHFASRSIYPSGGAMMVGESTALSVNGQSIPPYIWSVNDTTVASISASGILKAKKRGKLMVTVVDSAGAPATENRFEVFDTKIITRDTSICRFDQIVEYPVVLKLLPISEQIFSMEGAMRIDTSRLAFIGLEAVGTATQGWALASNEDGNNVSFAASSSNPLNKAGALIKLKFLPKLSFNSSSTAAVNLNAFSFNEGNPLPLIDDYFYIHGAVADVSTARITAVPSTVVCSGDVVRFSSQVVNGGAAAYQWFKNGNAISGANRDTLRIGSLVDRDTISCRVISRDPCAIDSIIYSNKVGIRVELLPVAPDTINGPVVVTLGSGNYVYSVPEISNASSYIWQLSPGVIGTSETNSISVHFEGQITSGLIRVQAANSCGGGPADSLHIKLNPTDLSTADEAKTILYPNPFNQELNVVLKDVTDANAVIEVYDATGRLLMIDNNKQHLNDIVLDFKGRLPGLYLIKVSYIDRYELYKVVKR